MPITPSKSIWFDGELVPWEEANIHVLSHSLHYGSGVFEGIRAYPTSRGPAIFRLTDHINRLFNSAKILSDRYAVHTEGSRRGVEGGGPR